jgi:hypothetical protein
MSIKVMSLVWENFKRGGSEKLTMLALADRSDDEGGSLHPSISYIAKRINASESQARRIIHKFIDEGYLTVIANHKGGNPGKSRHYILNVHKLSTPGASDTPFAIPTPCMDAHNPLHGCATPLAPMTPDTSLSIIDTESAVNHSKKQPSLSSSCSSAKVKYMRRHDDIPKEKEARNIATEGNKKIPFPVGKFKLTREMLDYGNSLGLSDDYVRRQTEDLRDKSLSNGWVSDNWPAFWNFWIRKSADFLFKQGGTR